MDENKYIIVNTKERRYIEDKVYVELVSSSSEIPTLIKNIPLNEVTTRGNIYKMIDIGVSEVEVR